MRLQRLIYSSVFQVINKVSSFAINFLTIPILLASLGKENYGVYVAIIAIVNWFLVDNGVGEAVKFELLKKDPGHDRTATISAGLIILIFVQIVFTLVVVSVSYYTTPQSFFNSSSISSSVWWVFYFAFMLIPLKLVREVLTADQKGYIFSIIQIIGAILWMIGVKYLSVIGIENIVSFCMVYFIPMIVLQLVVFIFLFRRDLMVQRSIWMLIRILGLKSLTLLVFGVSRGLVNLLPIFFINRIYGGSIIAEVSVILKLLLLIEVLNGMILYPLWPSLRDAINCGDRNWVKWSRILLPITFCLFSLMLLFLIEVVPELASIITNVPDFITIKGLDFLLYFALVRLTFDYATFLLRISENIFSLGLYQLLEFLGYLIVMLNWRNDLDIDVLFYLLAGITVITRIPQLLIGIKWFYYGLK